RSTDQAEVLAKFGALFGRDREQRRQAYVEVRVGDYRFDNTAPSSDAFEAQDNSPEDAYEARTDAPVDNDPAVLRGALWLLTDQGYKRALTMLLKKKGKRIQQAPGELEDVPSFARE